MNRMNWDKYTDNISKPVKIAALVVAALLILMGIWLLIKPLRSLIAFEYGAAVALILYGVFRLIGYFRQGKGERSSWILVNAILLMLTGVLVALQGPVATGSTFAFLFCFISLTNGISKFAALSAMKAAGASTGGVVLSGILDIIVAIFFMIAPFITSWVFAIMAGIYLIIGGLTMLAEFGMAKTK